MNVDVKVKNLGKIKEATFKVRPITVITGYNGTGKSFFTKSLYSIFNVINKNVYHEAISREVKLLQLGMSIFIDEMTNENSYNESIQKIQSDLIKLQKDINEAKKWKIFAFLAFAQPLLSDVKEIQEIFMSNFNKDINEIKKYKETNNSFHKLINYLEYSWNSYSLLIQEGIESELKDNFQISSLNELISFNELSLEILIENNLIINASTERFSVTLSSEFIDDIANLSSVVFFESPAYWRVSNALKAAKNNQVNDDILIGVPKYFYDLDNVLNTKTKTAGCFESIAYSLEETLGGEFVFKNDNISFKDKKTGRDISKNLISFGMTNLGMIQALLKHNVITEGSFIFIDEPETNLHPEWQVILINVLLELASKGVNVIITTHSTDIIKALEVNIKKQKIEKMEDFISVHFVELDGKLLKFESKDVQKQLIEARNILSSAYETLYFSDL
jgi:predicted ATPase